MPAPPAPPAPSKPAVNAPSAVPKPAVPAVQPAPRPLPKAPAAKAPAASPPIPFNPFPSPPVAAPTPAVPVAPIQCSPSLVATANALGFGSVPFLVGIDRLASAWPAGVRQELAQLKIPDAKIAFPTVEICEGLKRGRIQYPWRTLRAWLQPTPFYATPSPYDDTMIELPLNALTPLFLEFIRNNSTDRGVASSEGITEFFRRAEALSGTSAEPLRVVEQPVSISAPVVTPFPAPASPAPQAQPAAPAAFAPAAAATPTALEEASTGAPPSVSAIENGKLCLPVNQICQAWPEPILRDVQQFNLSGARIEIPVEQVEPGLKAGRIEFTWGQLCTWLQPASRAAQVSINAELRLPLPLNVVAPIFVKQRDAGGGKKRVRVEESIPDVFSAAGKPVVASTVASHQSTQASAPVPESAAAVESAPTAARPRKLPATVSELFGEPDKKSWTPNEIVQRAVTLPNVAGSLIAMQDGLLVAHFMPPTVKTETIAAFVPQIFGRLNQYCKELQMGEAHEVSFAVDVGTVHVFNAGIIYFAALSKPGVLLPVPELQLITSELSRHTK
jgi:predicted regulator of Ras-like GTPase activity (Roadblock/LC7/MglB family)